MTTSQTATSKKHKQTVDAVRCSLEMALMLLDELPEGLDEKEMATALINDALLTSLRLGLEVVLTDFQAARPTLHLVYSEDLAS